MNRRLKEFDCITGMIDETLGAGSIHVGLEAVTQRYVM
jgi:hypothetical protein